MSSHQDHVLEAGDIVEETLAGFVAVAGCLKNAIVFGRAVQAGDVVAGGADWRKVYELINSSRALVTRTLASPYPMSGFGRF